MDKAHYDEYRDIFCVINKRTFNTFVKLYEDGPIKVKDVKRHRSINELIKGGFARKYWSNEDCDYFYGTTVIGERVFEAVAEVCDGWGMGSKIRYDVE